MDSAKVIARILPAVWRRLGGHEKGVAIHTVLDVLSLTNRPCNESCNDPRLRRVRAEHLGLENRYYLLSHLLL
jgi:hypothetical protein